MPAPFALGAHKLMAFVATTDPRRAKAFYGRTLGLRLVSEDLFAVVFDANGTLLRVAITQELTPAKYTVLGWQVPDIAMAARGLAQSGVTFERFPGMPQDDLGVWTAPGGNKVAWFKDPEGNILSISQH
jgi:catechol 2,3-dioxygenase-like lactoylglutathione lyase family enzyme